MEALHIPAEKILPNPKQPRQIFADAELLELGESMRQNGQIQAVEVEEAASGFYILHDGERRWRAARLVGIQALRATLAPPDSGNDRDRLLRALVANVQREPLTPVEEARSYGELREMGMPVDEIARKIGKNRKTVDDRLMLLQLEGEIQGYVERRLIPSDARVSKALLQLDSERRLKLARMLATRPGITIKAIVRAVERLLNSKPTDKTDDTPPALRGANTRKPMAWNALHQAGQVPSWAVVVSSTEVVCRNCALSASASETVCRDCPVVDLLKRMITEAETARKR